MVKKYCLKLVKNEFIFLGIFLFVGFILQSSKVFAASVDTINIEGKIVRNDSGYEGMNISTGSPACVVSGSANDTCDFQVKYYSASTSGTLFLTETFSNKEIGQYNGAFNLSLGSGTVTAGTYASLDAVILAEDTVYLEIGFSPAGNASFTETFSRMPLQASAYAIRSKYSSEADTAFQFDTASNSSGYTTPTAGMVYFDTTDSELKLYDGSSWTDISGGAGVAPSLWTDAGDYSYLTSTTDHLVLGSTYIEIGVNNYATYLSGLASNSPFAFDMDGERLSVSGDKAQSGLTVYSNYTSTGAWPLVVFKSEYSGFDNTVLEVTQDGTGSIASFKKGSAEVFAFENEKTFFIGQRADAPVTYTDRLYNVGGTLYWSGSSVCTLATGCGVGASLWTDGGTYTYLTSSTDDLIVGGTTPATSAFFFDVSTGRLGIGTSTPTASLDIAGATSSIANASGDITISADDTLVVKANDTEADNLMEWQNSVGTVLGLINQSGYVTFGNSTSSSSSILTLGANSSANNIVEWQNTVGTVLGLINQSGYATFGNSTGSSSAILALGANTTAVTQVNLASSAGVDVASPISGDLWWNGTNLYFYDGTESIDLLGAPEMVGLTNAYGSVSNGSYLNLQHDQNTYAVVADGWVCVGGSSNESCSGGNWVNIGDSSTTIGHYVSNVWDEANTDGVIRADVNLTDVSLAESVDIGTGGDGSVTISANIDINTVNSIAGRSCVDGGDAVNYNITAFNSLGTRATLSTTPSSGCLKPGDEVLIINLQGTTSEYSNVGNYETVRISGVSGNEVTFQTPKTKYYGNGEGFDTNLGTTSGTYKVMLQRVPNYSDVTVNAGVTFSPSAWNGSKGGVLMFRANGTVSVGGTISANAKGYRSYNDGSGLFAGESYDTGYAGEFNGGGINANGRADTGGTGAGSCAYRGGGGAGGRDNGGDSNDGPGGGGGGGYGGGGGGGGGGADNGSYGGYGGAGGGTGQSAGGGGGGGSAGGNGGTNGSAGAAGTGSYHGAGGAGGSGTLSGGGAGGSVDNAGAGGAGGGGTYGDTELKKIYFGSAGGNGGRKQVGGYNGVAGGAGGGIVIISANNLSVSGGITSIGGNGTAASMNGAGGGGAGGSINLSVINAFLGSALVNANGGAGGARSSVAGAGGSGGVGRIVVSYSTSISGSTTPTYSGTSLGYYKYGIYNSLVVNTPNARSYENISWSEDLDTYGDIGVQTRSGGDSHLHLDYDHRDHIWIGSVFGLGNSNITFESWIRLNDNVDAASEIFNIGDSSTNGYGLALDGTSLKSLVVWYPGVRWTDTGVDLSSGWHHIALVINASGQPSVYIDGDMVYSDTGSAPVAPSSGESTTIGYGFGGYISDVRIWNTARTQSQIQDNRHNRLTGSESGLVGYWKLDEAQGTTVSDSTSNNNDGYLSRNIWEDTYSWSWESWKPYNLSESTNTEDSHVHYTYNDSDNVWIGSNLDLGSSNITFESWVRLDDNVDGSCDIFVVGNWSDNGYQLYVQSGTLWISYAGVRWIDTGVDITSGWHHVALVINASGQPIIYLDGELKYSDTGSAPLPPTTEQTIIGYNFGGYISDFRVWNTARTEGQIKNNMYNRLTGSESGLVGYWKLDEGVGTTLQDSTTNNNDGYLNRDIWEDTVSWTANRTGHTLLESANTHTNWTGTNSTVAEGDVTRNVDFFEDEDETTAGNITKVISSTNGGYAEATITASDLSNYDYLTLWVRASQIGNVLRIGIGESAATEQYEDITIDASNTWQKVYWDLSDIQSTSIDTVTKLRITNFSSSSNTIYIDNISAEKLLTDNEGSKIQSTPNNYLQYRIIFTTTNLSYQPRLENISITYNTGYQMVLYDSNNVRLYNYTGDTKYLKLSLVTSTVASGSVLGASTSSLMEFDEPSVLGLSTFTGDTEITGYFSNLLVNNTGQSNNLLKLQTNDTDMLVVNTSGDLGMKGDIAVDGGSISLGSDGNIRFNEETNTIEFSTDSGISWMSLGSQISKSYLFAEYAGAVFSADGSNNIGNMTADNTGSASNSMNYYEWNSSETSLNDYDVRVRFALPSNFESWGSGGITFNYSTESVDTASNEVDFYVFEETSLNIDGSAENNISPIAGEWSTATIEGSTLNECNIANGICVLSIKLSSSNDNYVRIGDIEITYNRSI